MASRHEAFVSITATLIVQLLVSSLLLAGAAGNFYDQFDVVWGDGRVKILDRGQRLTLSMDKTSGSGFRSKRLYLFGMIDMQLKLVPGNSAGTVTTCYLTSMGNTHDEIDFEFLGNSSGEPYILHTNIYAQGKGDKEQQFYLWFDPTQDFHTYSILWNPLAITFYVDRIPIRKFKNLESYGVPFPKKQPMWIYGSLWDGEDWATQGGRVKTDWSQAPFTASYRNFRAQACVQHSESSSCSSKSSWLRQSLKRSEREIIAWVQKHFMIYNYCADAKRFPHGLPPECSLS